MDRVGTPASTAAVSAAQTMDASIEPDTSTTRISRQSAARRARVRNTGRSGTTTDRPSGPRACGRQVGPQRARQVESGRPDGGWAAAVPMPVSAGRIRVASCLVSSSTSRAHQRPQRGQLRLGQAAGQCAAPCAAARPRGAPRRVELGEHVVRPAAAAARQHLLADARPEQRRQLLRPTRAPPGTAPPGRRRPPGREAAGCPRRARSRTARPAPWPTRRAAGGSRSAVGRAAAATGRRARGRGALPRCLPGARLPGSLPAPRGSRPPDAEPLRGRRPRAGPRAPWRRVWGRPGSGGRRSGAPAGRRGVRARAGAAAASPPRGAAVPATAGRRGPPGPPPSSGEGGRVQAAVSATRSTPRRSSTEASSRSRAAGLSVSKPPRSAGSRSRNCRVGQLSTPVEQRLQGRRRRPPAAGPAAVSRPLSRAVRPAGLGVDAAVDPGRHAVAEGPGVLLAEQHPDGSGGAAASAGSRRRPAGRGRRPAAAADAVGAGSGEVEQGGASAGPRSRPGRPPGGPPPR